MARKTSDTTRKTSDSKARCVNNNNNNNNLTCKAPVCAKKDSSGAGGQN